MIEFLKRRWVLMVVLLVFIICKVPHLAYPYYWDESWPYMPAIKAMFNNGISLSPGAMEVGLSRGHPLLFHALAAGWMKLFGCSHIATHTFALFVSLVLLITLYEAGLSIFNKRVAIMATILVATQELFFVQSSFMLPEVLVALLAFTSLCFYIRDKYVLSALSLTALFFTKESGMVMGLVLGLDALVGAFNSGTPLRIRLSRLGAIAIPCILIGVFFLIQKQMRGWYVFPYHTEIMEHSWKAFWYKFRMACMRDVFYLNYKYYYFLLLAALAIGAAIKNKAWRYLVVLLPVVIIYYFVDDLRAGRLLPPIQFFLVFIGSVFYFLYIFGGATLFQYPAQRRLIRLAGLFILCFICFSTINFYTNRYLLAGIVPLIFILAAFYDALVTATFKPAYYGVVVFILVLAGISIKTNDDYGDTNLGAYKAMAIQQSMVTWLEGNNAYDKSIAAGSFMAKQHLLLPETGFLKSEKVFRNVKWDIDKATEYAVFDNIEPDNRYNEVIKDSSWHLVFRKADGKIWTEIYGRK